MRLVNRGRTRVRQPAGKTRKIQRAPTHRPDLRAYVRESGGLIAGEAGAERATAAYAAIFLHERERGASSNGALLFALMARAYSVHTPVEE